MNSEEIKLAILDYLRYKRQYIYVATEVGDYNSDVLAVDKKNTIEVEVKTSKSDLRKDRKKRKHRRYKERRSYEGIPNKFYFAVEEELKEAAIRECESLNPNYGVIVVSKTKWKHKYEVSIVRNAKVIHRGTPTENMKNILAKRMSSEIVCLTRRLIK